MKMSRNWSSALRDMRRLVLTGLDKKAKVERKEKEIIIWALLLKAVFRNAKITESSQSFIMGVTVGAEKH